MFTKIQKWGNSQGLRFPKFLLEEANIKVGDDVNISVKKGKIIIEPKANIRKKYDIKELISKFPKNYNAEEIDWGSPVGKEEW
jgi:antitoxin MazE